MRETETRESFADFFARLDAGLRAFTREPLQIVWVLRERRGEKRRPRGERERVGKQTRIACKLSRLARMLRRKTLEEETRAFRVRKIVD